MKKYSVISNTTPLIAFIKKNELVLLNTLFNTIFIPKAVYDEIINIPNALDKEKEILKEEIQKKWIIIKNVEITNLPELNLGKGEIEALNLSVQMDNPLLLIDEKKGRNIAKSLKIDVLGTLGILALAHNRALKNKQELLDNLNFLIKKGFYLSSEVILTFINSFNRETMKK